jgi:hypothetical protein
MMQVDGLQYPLCAESDQKCCGAANDANVPQADIASKICRQVKK